MAGSPYLNQRQLEVLRWISIGCPDGVWPDESHKLSARALANRRLVTVSRVKGAWTARITPAGTDYLSHNESPRGEGRAGAATPSIAPTPHLAAAEGVIAQILRSGGIVDLGEVDRSFEVQQVLRASRQATNRPADKILRLHAYGGWADRYYQAYLEDDLSLAVERVPVPVPTRIVQPHLAVAAYKADSDRHEVTRDSLSRATRLLQAVAVTATARGHSLEATSHPSLTHAAFQRSLNGGQFSITVDRFQYGLRIREVAARGGAKLDWSRRESMPRWRSIRNHTFVPSGRLKLILLPESARDGRPTVFEDSVKGPLEELLPEVLWELEVRALEDARRLNRERVKREQAERRRADELAEAKVRYEHNHRLTELARQAEQWGRAQNVRAYLTALADVVASMGAGEDREEAEAWLAWSQSVVDALDPLHGDLRTPTAPESTSADLVSFMKNGGSG